MATMITIVNISERPSTMQYDDYEVQINATVIATFRHRRADGLAVCLKEAALAVERDQP